LRDIIKANVPSSNKMTTSEESGAVEETEVKATTTTEAAPAKKKIPLKFVPTPFPVSRSKSREREIFPYLCPHYSFVVYSIILNCQSESTPWGNWDGV
jgi:hypothetical protein